MTNEQILKTFRESRLGRLCTELDVSYTSSMVRELYKLFNGNYTAIEVGSKLKVLKNTLFCDGTRETIGDSVIVTEDTIDYYRLFVDNYEVIKEQSK